MRRYRATVMMALAVSCIALAIPAWAQVEVQPDVVNRLPAGLAPGIGARAAAMGDAHVALATDATAFYWNPAGLALSSGQEWHVPSARYRSDNLGVGNLMDMLDIINSDGGLTLADYGLLERLEGGITHVGGSAMVGYRNRNWAVGAYTQGTSGFSIENTGGLDLLLVAYGLDVTSAGGAYAGRLADDLYWGVQVGWMKGGGGRTRTTVTDDGAGNITTNAWVRTNHATDWNANLGLMYQATDRVRCGLVARNVNSPRLNFWAGDVVDFDPSMHLGVAGWSADGRTVYAADLHNVFGSNGESAELCLGAEHLVSDNVALRAGLNDGRFTFGAGVELGSVQLAIASGMPLDEELTLTASVVR